MQVLHFFLTHRPLFPPVFSNNRTFSIVIPFSTALHISYSVNAATAAAVKCLHLDAGLRLGACCRFQPHAAAHDCDRNVDVGQRQRMAQRNQLGGLLRRLNARRCAPSRAALPFGRALPRSSFSVAADIIDKRFGARDAARRFLFPSHPPCAIGLPNRHVSVFLCSQTTPAKRNPPSLRPAAFLQLAE